MLSFNQQLAIACCTSNPLAAVGQLIADNYILEGNESKFYLSFMFEMVDIYFPIKSHELYVYLSSEPNYDEIFYFLVGKVRNLPKVKINQVLKIDIDEELATHEYR